MPDAAYHLAENAVSAGKTKSELMQAQIMVKRLTAEQYAAAHSGSQDLAHLSLMPNATSIQIESAAPQTLREATQKKYRRSRMDVHNDEKDRHRALIEELEG